MSGEIGKWLILIGFLILIAGVIFWLFGDRLNWLGNLPGDIRVERDNFRFYFPVTTMILISVLLSIIFTVAARFLRWGM